MPLNHGSIVLLIQVMLMGINIQLHQQEEMLCLIINVRKQDLDMKHAING